MIWSHLLFICPTRMSSIFRHPENRGISLCDTHLQSGAQQKICQPGFGATQSNIDFRPALERQVILLKIFWHCEMTPSHFFIEQKNHLVCHNNAFGNIDYVIGVSSWPSKCRSSRSYEASLIPFQQRTLQSGCWYYQGVGLRCKVKDGTAIHCTGSCCSLSSAGVGTSEANTGPVSWVKLAPQQVLLPV